LNEELQSTNEELKNKVDQLARTNSDLQNFIESTQVPTIFLDKRMRIRTFTPATRSLFRFQDQDRGRLFSDVTSRVDCDEAEALVKRVLQTGEPVEQELSIDDGRESYVLRVLPYRDFNETMDGVILVFSDVTNIRSTQAALERNEGIARQRSLEIEKLYKTAPVGMALVDRNRRFLKINQHFADLRGRPIEDHLGRVVHDVLPAEGTRGRPRGHRCHVR
jgi:two-component system, chemotaxis family, CheB/CheR fusion protein